MSNGNEQIDEEIRELCYQVIIRAKMDSGKCPACGRVVTACREEHGESLACSGGCFSFEMHYGENDKPTAGHLFLNKEHVTELVCANCGMQIFVAPTDMNAGKVPGCACGGQFVKAEK